MVCHAGIRQVTPYGKLNPVEQKALEACIPELKSSIDKGIKFANGEF